MTTKQELGRVERVELRDVWEREDSNFTPWLAENISLLGGALGMNLEVRAQETAVGIYWLDILAHDRDKDSPVVIENQLGVTDHNHLGKLLTYAAGFNANTMVWIAGEFRDEHREALDLLNQRTDEDTQFFGVEMELTKIGNSLPAPSFKLVAIPRKWRNPKQRSGSGSRGSERYRQFYQDLVARLNKEVPGFTDLSGGAIGTQHHLTIAPAGQNVRYSTSFNNFGSSQMKAWVQLVIRSGDRDWDQTLFNKLKKHKEKIESEELQEPLVWRPDHFRQSGIMVPWVGNIDNSPETLQEIQDWMVDRLLKFKKVFGPRLAELVE